MSELTSAADAMADAADDKGPTMAEAQAAAAAGEVEGTTPEEVAAVLKGSGINLPPEPVAKDDEEEGNLSDEEKAAKAKADAEKAETDEERETREAEEAAEQERKDIEEAEAAAVADKKAKAEAAAAASQENDDKYAFEVTDANGVTFKIAPGATMEEILAEFEPKNNGQIIDILNKLQKAEASQAADAKIAAEEATAVEHQERIDSIQKGWQAEVTDLIAQKRIAEGEEGETRKSEVFKFMSEENDARIKAGKPTLQSFEDALDKLETKETREQKIKDDKAAKEETRRKGGLVGGSSAPASSGAPVYKAGSARNVNEALRAQGLL